jgi:hypothetical protein
MNSSTEPEKIITLNTDLYSEIHYDTNKNYNNVPIYFKPIYSQHYIGKFGIQGPNEPEKYGRDLDKGGYDNTTFSDEYNPDGFIYLISPVEKSDYTIKDNYIFKNTVNKKIADMNYTRFYVKLNSGLNAQTFTALLGNSPSKKSRPGGRPSILQTLFGGHPSKPAPTRPTHRGYFTLENGIYINNETGNQSFGLPLGGILDKNEWTESTYLNGQTYYKNTITGEVLKLLPLGATVVQQGGGSRHKSRRKNRSKSRRKNHHKSTKRDRRTRRR